MLGVHLAELTSVQDAGVTDALEVVAGFDAALVGGFGRIGDEAADALAGLAAAVSGSPLSSAAAASATALDSGEP